MKTRLTAALAGLAMLAGAGAAHADGELVVLPEQRKSRLVARVLPRHLRVLAGPALNG